MNPNDKDKRAIDDPQLNQDVNFERKDEEDFDDSDDFHKYDNTDENTSESSDIEEKKTSDDGLNTKNEPLNTDGRFDGTINI